MMMCGAREGWKMKKDVMIEIESSQIEWKSLRQIKCIEGILSVPSEYGSEIFFIKNINFTHFIF